MRLIELPELPQVTRLTAVVLLIVPLAVLIIIVFASDMLTRPDPGTVGIVAGIASVLVLTDGLIIGAIRGNRVMEDQQGLSLRATGFLKRRLRFDQVDWRHAAVIDARGDRERGLRWRTFGLGMPGLYAGYFRLRNGQKCFAIVVGREAVYLPTHDGQAVIVAMKQARAWLRRHQGSMALNQTG